MTDRRKQSSIRLVVGTLFVLFLLSATTLVAPLLYDIDNWFLIASRIWFLRSSPHHLRKSSAGVSFQRTISNFPSNSTFLLKFGDKKCQDSDTFGDNHCHYDWGDHVSADYSIFVDETLTDAAFVHGTFKVSQQGLKHIVVHSLTHYLFILSILLTIGRLQSFLDVYMSLVRTRLRFESARH